jgi:cytochrome P450
VREQVVQQQVQAQPLVLQAQVVERVQVQLRVLQEQEPEHRRYRQLLQSQFPPEQCHLRVRESR